MANVLRLISRTAQVMLQAELETKVISNNRALYEYVTKIAPIEGRKAANVGAMRAVFIVPSARIDSNHKKDAAFCVKYALNVVVPGVKSKCEFVKNDQGGLEVSFDWSE